MAVSMSGVVFCRFLTGLAVLFLPLVPVQAQFSNPLFLPDTLPGPIVNLSFGSSSKSLFPGPPTQTLSYNGQAMLGPTLIFRRGWNIEANITNNLSDTTTFHWHGLHLPAHADGGPHSPILPGAVWSPHFTCLNRAGTSWYHPHFHGKTGRQTMQGGAGFILIRDAAEAALPLPRTYGVDDFPLALHCLEFDSQNQILPESNRDSILLVNATRNPYQAVPARYVRLRLLNASNARNFALGFADNQGFWVIGSDGGLLPRAVWRNRIRIAPGERYEIVVDFRNRANDTLRLRNFGSAFSYGYQGGPNLIIPPGFPSQDSPLNGIDYDVLEFRVGEAQPVTQPDFNPQLVADPGPDPNLVQEERIVSFKTLTPGTAVGPFVLNDSTYRKDRIDYRIPLQNREIWTIHNQTPAAHPFHMHGFHFYILDRYGAPPDSVEMGRKDMVQVGPNELLRIWVHFSNFPDTTMPYMYHCHILTHEDEGMMGQFVVAPLVTSRSKTRGASPKPLVFKDAQGNWQWNPAVPREGKLEIWDVQCRLIGSIHPDEDLRLPGLVPGIYWLRFGETGMRISVD